MSIYHTTLNTEHDYYPIGNTPPVCLTQDLPPELQNVDILLLGCGDARHVLFTCFADSSRKIDVTCCDIEPMIHARNVLLYTLLIDDESNHNIEKIWNIYYQWKINEDSLKLLESQAEKLRPLSESIGKWHNSIYGSSIRFCDERSLSSVRSYWSGFTSQNLLPSQKRDWLIRMQTAINKAKANHKKFQKSSEGTGYRSTFPTAKNDEAWKDLSEIIRKWWDCGMVPSSNSSHQKFIHLNPAFLYSPHYLLTIYFSVSPLGGIPLSNAYTSIDKGSVFCVEDKGASSTERLVDCAKNHFKQWASAFRRTMSNGSVIRIFSGDMSAFCFTLRNCQLTGSTSMNLFCHNRTSSPLILHNSNYGHNCKNPAPLNFDIIDTSNLMDFLGPLNLLTLGSSLLKHHVSSCLYTELLVMFDFNPVDQLSDLLCADVRSMAFLLRLVPPDLSTNATNNVEEFRNAGFQMIKYGFKAAQAFSRLRWRRSRNCKASCNSPHVQIEWKELAKLLIHIHEEMFKLDILSRYSNSISGEVESSKLHLRIYNRASFAFLLSILRANVASDWDACLCEMYRSIFISASLNTDYAIRSTFAKDLLLNLLSFGIDDSVFRRPDPTDVCNSVVASVLSKLKDVPDQICVTVQVPREHLRIITKMPATLSIICSIETGNPDGDCWINSFASVQIVFGKWHKQTKKDDSHPYIEEDYAQLSGTSDMFVSVMVPTSILTTIPLQVATYPTMVKCKLRYSKPIIKQFHGKLKDGFCFSSSPIISKNVFITQFMPGMSGLPKFTMGSNQQSNPSSDATVVHLSSDGSKINYLVKRLTLESEAARTKLAMRSSAVKVRFDSPLTAVISIAESLEFKLEFPVPVSRYRYMGRNARTSSYIEVESRLFDPMEEDAPAFLFPCFLTEVPGGIVPAAWTSTRIDLDLMPPLNVNTTPRLYGLWLHDYALQMFSVQESIIRKSNSEYTFRVDLKEGLLHLFRLSTEPEVQRVNYFGLKMDNRLHTLIVPSCLRLDFASNTVVLDCALIPLTDTALKDPLVTHFLQDLSICGLFFIQVKKDENLAWKGMMPALAERCRTWKHTSGCEYIQAGEVPLPKGLSDDNESSICSCGIGKFPADYLDDQVERFSALGPILDQYATRVAISLIFSIPYIENCKTVDIRSKFCEKCCSDKRKNAPVGEQNLLACSRCKKVKYCSKECQKADWESHKLLCKAE